MPITSQTIIKRLQAAGWHKVEQTGSHVHFKHSTKPGKVTVPHPRRDFSMGTLKSIERPSGVKLH